MSVDVLCIGGELLVGDTVNTNMTWIGKELDRLGIEVKRETTVPDDPALMRLALQRGLAESRLVITIGGLGPTADDRTKDMVSELLGTPMALDEDLHAHLKAWYEARGKQVAPHVFTIQAMVPAGAAVLRNAYGTAPGLWCETADGRAVLMLPGPPREMQAIMEDHALARIAAHVPPSIARRSIAVHGLGESTVEGRVIQALAGMPQVDPAYNIKPGKIHVRLSVPYADAALLEPAVAALKAEFGAAAMGVEENMVTQVAAPLRARGWQLATAESCTGGAIATQITDEAGVSDFFAGSLVTYSNALKTALLGVPPETIAAHGAVSEETAHAMVAGLVARLGVQVGIAVTGIAGPDGGTPEKPVGTVYIATAVDGDIRVAHVPQRGNRASVRDKTVISALLQLHRHLHDRLD